MEKKRVARVGWETFADGNAPSTLSSHERERETVSTASEFLDCVQENGHKMERSTSFSWTCSRLSQYIREKGGFGDLILGLSFNPDATSGNRDATELHALAPEAEVEQQQQQKGADDGDGSSLELFPQHAGFGGAFSNTLNPNSAEVLPKVGGPGGAKMTIFYAGRMVVFQDVPSQKAEAVMQYMGGGGRGGITTMLPIAPTTITASNASYLPLARKASLQRFLEMRKDRLSSKAPYKTSANSAFKNEKSAAGSPQSAYPVSIGFAPGVPASTKSWLGSEPNSQGFKLSQGLLPMSPLDSSSTAIS